MSILPLEVVILAAGQGTRMCSKVPKVLHPLLGRSMLGYAVKSAQALGAENIVVVTGHGAEQVETSLEGQGVTCVRQEQRLGTGHAFLQAAPALKGGPILLLYGDTPLIQLETLKSMLEHHQSAGAGLTILTGELEDASGYGRIVRDSVGGVLEIVEEKSASFEQKKIREFNSGVYLMDARAPQLAGHIQNTNAAGEYYLTDLLALYRAEGARVEAFKVADSSELMGANDRLQLADAARVLQGRINGKHMRAGVTLLDSSSTFIEDTVEIGPDTTLAAGVHLLGSAKLGEGVQVGPYSILDSSQVGDHTQIGPYTIVKDCLLEGGCIIHAHSVLNGARVAQGADVGPFARLRPGATLEQDVHVGNFVEVKNARLGAGSKAGHLAYLGDADFGREVNVGAGTITANYNGLEKNLTRVEDGAFIGSNSVLIAPITVGRGAIVAAGSALSHDVPEGALGLARARQENKAGFARRYWKGAGTQLKLKVLRAWLEENSADS